MQNSKSTGRSSTRISADDAFNWALSTYSLTRSAGYYTESMATQMRGRAAFAVVARDLGFLTNVPNDTGGSRSRMGWTVGIPTMEHGTKIYNAYVEYMQRAEDRKTVRRGNGFDTAKQEKQAGKESDSTQSKDKSEVENAAIRLLSSIDAKLSRLLEIWEPDQLRGAAAAPKKVSLLKDIDQLSPAIGEAKIGQFSGSPPESS